VATAVIEKGWHVFTAEPGGDGFLIPTTMTLEKNAAVVTYNEKLETRSKVITHTIPEIGTVNYVEGKAEFILPVLTNGNTTVKGVFSFQSCNDKMCLPPVDQSFTIELK
jgi:hypothetical protein